MDNGPALHGDLFFLFKFSSTGSRAVVVAISEAILRATDIIFDSF